MTSTVCCCASTRCLCWVIRAFRLTTKRTLINTPFFSTREWQTHVFQFKYSFRADGTHVLNRILVADIVGTFDGVINVPTPIVIWVSTRDRTGNTALGRYGV